MVLVCSRCCESSLFFGFDNCEVGRKCLFFLTIVELYNVILDDRGFPDVFYELQSWVSDRIKIRWQFEDDLKLSDL